MKTYYYVRLADCDLLMSLDDNFKCKYITDTDIEFPNRGEEYEFLKEHLSDENWKKKRGKMPHSVFASLILNNQIVTQIDKEIKNENQRNC